eukprot:gene53211-60871_t
MPPRGPPKLHLADLEARTSSIDGDRSIDRAATAGSRREDSPSPTKRRGMMPPKLQLSPAEGSVAMSSPGREMARPLTDPTDPSMVPPAADAGGGGGG